MKESHIVATDAAPIDKKALQKCQAAILEHDTHAPPGLSRQGWGRHTPHPHRHGPSPPWKCFSETDNLE